MKRLEPESIGDVLRQTLEERNMTRRLLETRACALWPRIVGPEMAALCSRPAVRNGVMTVGVPAAPLRNELAMSRSSLIGIINETLRSEVITDIRFIS